MRYHGFIGPTYTLTSLPVEAQRTVNLFPELDELQTQADGEIASLHNTPGKRKLATIGTGPIRGVYLFSKVGRAFVVSGTGFYELYANWTYTLRGNLSNSTGPCRMTDNGFELLIPDGLSGYIFNANTNAFTKITASGYYGGDTPVGQDGYFLIQRPGTDQYVISDINNGLAWDPLDNKDIGGIADKIVSVSSVRRNIVILGEKTCQWWWNSGDASFPFTRIDNASSEYGCKAPFSVGKFAESVIWLGGGQHGEGLVLMTAGDQPTRVSNYAIERIINEAGDITGATGWTYQEAGHPFYVLNLPGHETSLCYDVATQQWHERGYWSEGEYSRDRGDCCMLAFGSHVVGDYENGNIYALENTTYTDDGAPIVWMRRAPHLTAEKKRIFHNGVEFDIEMGVGLDGVGQGTDPQIMLRYSDDGGHTWSHEKQGSIGKIGEYRKRVTFNRLGQSRDRVYELRGSDPVKTRILGAVIDVEKGRT